MGILRKLFRLRRLSELTWWRSMPERLMMKRLKGVIHVGANLGQERDRYARDGLNVLWIEPIPWVFKDLKNAISSYPKQQALEYLVLDKDGQPTTLHVSNNEGASSSILELSLHRNVWPSVKFMTDIKIRSHKLDTIIERERINLSNFDGLVVDTQGSELLVLKGAERVLRNMRMVKVEVADFESYSGCPKPKDIAEFLGKYGLEEWKRLPFAEYGVGGLVGGRYYDIIYRKG